MYAPLLNCGFYDMVDLEDLLPLHPLQLEQAVASHSCQIVELLQSLKDNPHMIFEGKGAHKIVM